MRILGFVGPAGCGKDTASRLLKENKNIVQKNIPIAGPLKELCSTFFEISPQFLNAPHLKEKEFATPINLTHRILRRLLKEMPTWVPEINQKLQIIEYNCDAVPLNGIENRIVKTPRQLMQVIGTDLIRNRVWEDWHLRAAFSPKVMDKLNAWETYAVTDIRFVNELLYLQDNFPEFEAYYIENPEAEKVLAKATHASETTARHLKELLGSDRILKNEGSLEDFAELLVKKFHKLKVAKSSEDVPKKKSRLVWGTKKL